MVWHASRQPRLHHRPTRPQPQAVMSPFRQNATGQLQAFGATGFSSGPVLGRRNPWFTQAFNSASRRETFARRMFGRVVALLVLTLAFAVTPLSPAAPRAGG